MDDLVARFTKRKWYFFGFATFFFSKNSAIKRNQLEDSTFSIIHHTSGNRCR